MSISPLIVFATAIAAVLLLGGLINTAYRLGARLGALETWRGEMEQVNAARVRAKRKAPKETE